MRLSAQRDTTAPTPLAMIQVRAAQIVGVGSHSDQSVLRVATNR